MVRKSGKIGKISNKFGTFIVSIDTAFAPEISIYQQKYLLS